MRSKIEAGHSPRGHFRIDSSLQAQQVHRLNEQCLRGLATVGRDQCFKEIREPGGFVFAHRLTLELASEHSSPAAPKPVAWARIEKSVAPVVGELEKAGVGDLIVHRTGQWSRAATSSAGWLSARQYRCGRQEGHFKTGAHLMPGEHVREGNSRHVM